MNSNVFQFEVGKPACPVACKYCFITEHDKRRELWNKKSLLGINKASTFINVSPWINENIEEQKAFYSFPFELLEADVVGFTAISDPFWPRFDKYREYFFEKASPLAKLVTCVTKWPLKRETLKRLSAVENFALVLGITGNKKPIEAISVEQHLETLRLAKEEGVDVLPISHPYISGVSDLWFLGEIKNLGYDYFDVKGFRYCDRVMKEWMPAASRNLYIGRDDEEVLVEDGWRERVASAGLNLLSPQKWYQKKIKQSDRRLTKEAAEQCVSKVFEYANVVSSDSTNSVRRFAVERRL